MNMEKVKELRDSGMGASAIAKELGIGRASVYRALGYFLLNTLCISYGRIHNIPSLLFFTIALETCDNVVLSDVMKPAIANSNIP